MDAGLNYIDGEWRRSRSGETFEQCNPADLDQVTGLHQSSGAEDVRDAVTAAERAFPQWRRTPPVERARFLRRALDAMQVRSDEIARQITLENGKTIEESHAEIRSAIAEMDFQISEGLRLYGQTVPSSRAGVFAFSIREPLGVVSIITPWNFPWNVPGRKCTPALMAGNTVVFKPASLTPGVGRIFAELFVEAGLPPGVLNFVTGGGGTVGREMVENPAVKAVSFTGSTAIGRGIHESAARTLARTQLEMGGKNPAVVLADADMDLALDACFRAAFACAGQWCTSTSRVIVEESAYDHFVAELVARAKALRVGDGASEGTQMGPVCGEQQLRSILGYIEAAKREGATTVYGGARLTEGGLGRGCFVAPTIFVDVDPSMHIASEEVFGPVVCVLRTESLDQAIAIANNVNYGLASSIFTHDLRAAHRFIEASEVGLTHVNMMTAYKEPALVFGGTKTSGAGLPEAGQKGIEFFTHEKAVYVNYG